MYGRSSGVIWSVIALSALGCSSKAKRRDDAAAAPPLVDRMVPVPAGWSSVGCYRLLASTEAESAEYGTPAGYTLDEDRIRECVFREPPRRVWLSSFEVDRFEVTRGEYQRCVDAGACERTPPAEWDRLYAGAGMPAVATYDDAEHFCRWRGKRLLTNAEWEKAGRGGDDRIYPWGDTPPNCSLVDEGTQTRDGTVMSSAACEIGAAPHPGGRHPAGASPFGVEDILDNVREWVSDWYGKSAVPPSMRAKLYINEKPPADGLGFRFFVATHGGTRVLEYDWASIAWVWKDRALVDPKGPPEPDGPAFHPHAIKGGTFGLFGADDAGNVRDETHREYAGFRCARSIAGPSAPNIPPMPANDPALPFHEAAYAPPGTSGGSGTERAADAATPAGVGTKGKKR